MLRAGYTARGMHAPAPHRAAPLPIYLHNSANPSITPRARPPYPPYLLNSDVPIHPRCLATRPCRRFFPLLLDITQQVMTGLAAAGPSAALDLDRVAQRLTIDVIGRFAFDRDFGATADIAKTNEALQVCARACQRA